LARLVEATRQRDPTIDPKLIPERIGERLEVSFGEYKRLCLTHVRPGDAPRHEVDQHISDRKAERELNRKRRDRERAKQAKASVAPPDPWDLPDDRAKSLACAPLSNREWWSIRALTEAACERLFAFNGLDHAAGRRAVLRTIRKLEGLGIVETKTEAGPRGLDVLYVRRLTTAAEIEAERQQLLDEVAMEQGSEVTEVT
jgi:hypothetical protein